ncbi:MAG: fumarate reductase [Myxococcales bacterium SG8_38]|nr:MAG: fumarate reductase [Myxococcales bacterium SG8_38]
MADKSNYHGEVVVIGGGLAGMVTALELLDAGKRVVMLDAATRDRFGGLALWSFGGMFFVDSPEQRKSRIKDSVDLAMRDWVRYGELDPEDVWPYRWAEAYVNRCTEEVRGWLVDRDVSFFRAVNWTERGYFVPGNSVPRFHIVWGTGEGIITALSPRLEEHEKAGRLQLHFGHRVDELIREAGGIVGCRGTSTDGAFEAHGDAVVIAAGGIAGSHDKVRAIWPRDRWGEPPEPMLNGSIPEADGHLLDRAAALGANVTHLEKMWNYAAGVRHWAPPFPNYGLSLVPGKSALWVNYQGRRFVNPPLVGSYDTLLLIDEICREQKKYSWQVMNRKIANKEFSVSGAEFNPAVREKKLLAFIIRLLKGNGEQVQEFIDHCPDFVTGRGVAELADKMNALTGTRDVDPKLLEREISEYDENIARGRNLQNDDQLRRIAHVRQYIGDRLRTCNMAPIMDASAMPLIAIRTQILTRKSLGGIQVDLDAKVLDKQGNPIPNLFAVGEACGFGGGGMHGLRALEGTFLGGCVYSGRVAARAILSGKGVR